MAPTSEMPSLELAQSVSNIAFQSPLSRSGSGPGLILIRPSSYSACQQYNTSLDPEPLYKWAEESFVVAQITLDVQSTHNKASVRALIQKAKDGLADLPGAEGNGHFALIGWWKLHASHD